QGKCEGEGAGAGEVAGGDEGDVGEAEVGVERQGQRSGGAVMGLCAGVPNPLFTFPAFERSRRWAMLFSPRLSTSYLFFLAETLHPCDNSLQPRPPFQPDDVAASFTFMT